MKRLVYSGFLLSTIVVALACAADRSAIPSTFSEAIVDGVRHVHNISPLWGEELRVGLEFVRQYGALITEDENLRFFRPSDVDVDAGGYVYILNAGDHQVSKLDSEGNFHGSFGKRGEGPGEFIGATRLDVWPGGRIVLNDRALRAINIFDHSGVHLNRISDPTREPMEILALASGDLAIHSIGVGISSDTVASTPLLSILRPDGSTLRQFVSSRVYTEPGANLFRNEIFIAADEGDNIYVSFGSQNRIEKYSAGGEILFRVDRELAYDETPGMEYDATQTDEGPLIAVSFNQISKGIQVDHVGRIWVGTKTRQRSREDRTLQDRGEQVEEEDDLFMLEIFDADGILLGRMVTDFYRGERFKIVGDRFFLVDRDEEMAVFEFKIVEVRS